MKVIVSELAQDEARRMGRILELMLLDPPKDTEEGRELLRLVDEQLQAEGPIT